MLNRMTIWAKHFKIVKIVVFAVAVFVVHTKNFRMRVVATTYARREHVSFKHVFAHCGEFCFPLRLMRFVDTRLRTIFALGGRRVQKCSSAMHTVVLNRSFSVHGLVIALRRTVLCLVSTAGNVAKNCAAFFAIRSDLHSCRKCKTLPAAIQRGVFAVRRYCERRATLSANFFVPNAGAGHAFSQVNLQRSV